MTAYPTQPTGDNSIDLTNIFASNSTSKIIMSSEEILEGYNNDGESATPLTSTPDGNKFNYFWYQVHNTLVWVVNYAKALFDNKLELSGGIMSGALAMGSNKITGLSAGTIDSDAVNKLQLDTAVNGAKWIGEIWEMAYPYIPTLPAGMEVVNADGRALNKSTYATLFSLIGTTYGGTEIGTTFNIPNLLGKSISGWDSVGTYDAGRAFGSDQKREASKFIKKYDYANAENKSSGVTYTASTNGLVHIVGGWVGVNSGFYIDGVEYNIHQSSSQGSQASGFAPVSKGQQYSFYGGVRWRFVPEIQSSESSIYTQTNIALYPVIRIK